MNYPTLCSIPFVGIVLLITFHSGSPRLQKCSYSLIPALSTNTIEENKQLTHQINRNTKLWQLKLIPSALVEAEAKETTNLSLALLDLSMQVVKSGCPDHFVSHSSVLDGALNVFAYLHENSGNVRYFDDPVNPFTYERIAPTLVACRQSVFPQNYYFSSGEDDGCPPTAATIRQVCEKNADYDLDVVKCTKLKLRTEKRGSSECFQDTNLILDVIWNIIEIVHVACFKEFQNRDDISAFHTLEQALEDLFTRKIRKYWYQSPLTEEMYQTILHPNVRQQLFNLEMCLEGISHLTLNKMPRLQRPPYPLLMYGKRRRKRSNS